MKSKNSLFYELEDFLGNDLAMRSAGLNSENVRFATKLSQTNIVNLFYSNIIRQNLFWRMHNDKHSINHKLRITCSL